MLAAETLAEYHGFKVSRETLRKWMQEDGIWLSRKQRRTFHQPRSRRECYGVDLSRFRAAPIAHLSGLSFECQGAFPT